ncbi:TadE/TadG family type IV pilus assembly protein [Gimesia chilikensis]|uniref:TadE-like protein n=1 Tax=Gimesia chilikensis TaxID=2605989 RepID=A0A517PJM6_9PLAN|nr:TadE family protein [Gimesia chilikensis]QDT19584.1 hypothetical protein HG66A1_13500 [Gimesia chilikensis]
MYKNSKHTRVREKQRSGAVVLELILTAPAFLIIMLSIVQISLIYTAIEQTAFASRYAAKIASETASGSLAALNTGPNGPLKTGVDNILYTGGLPDGSCRVILEYNVDTEEGIELTVADPTPAAANCDCDPPATALPAVAGTSLDQSVRTTVCVRLGNNIPDFLSSLGFSTQNYIVEESTTYMHEL